MHPDLAADASSAERVRDAFREPWPILAVGIALVVLVGALLA